MAFLFALCGSAISKIEKKKEFMAQMQLRYQVRIDETHTSEVMNSKR